MAITIGEAIEEQNLYLQHSDQWNRERLDKSIQLGIQALKRINNPLQYNLINPRILLPGEKEKVTHE